MLAQGNARVSNNVRAVACFVGGHYRKGIQFARNAIIESPNLIPAHRILIINSALAGELEEARAALQTLRGLLPNTSLAWVKEMAMPYTRAEDRQKYVEAFRLAGLE